MTMARPALSAIRRGVALLLAATLVAIGITATASVSAFAVEPPVYSGPEDVVANVGESATFTVTVQGAAFNYEWYRQGQSTVLGKQKTLTISDVTQADDGALFYVKFWALNSENQYVQVTSRAAMLIVGSPQVEFRSQPQDFTVFEGRMAHFTASVRGARPYTYQWQVSTDNATNWTTVEGESTDTYSLRAELQDDQLLVRALVSNTVSEPQISEPARLTVLPHSDEVAHVTNASFAWGLNNIYQGGNPAGNNCNNLSAGTQLAFAPSASNGNVRIVHETPQGYQSVSDGTRCINEASGSLDQRVLLRNGTGEVNLDSGVGVIEWEGAFLANAYGGLVPWWLKDLRLTIERDGSGTLTGIGGGYGSDMANPDEMHPIPQREVTVATFKEVTFAADGTITVQPDYAGVEVTVPESSTAEEQDRTIAGWGSWPQSFVDLHFDTGLSSYWYTSGLSADPDKPPHSFKVWLNSAPSIIELPEISTAPALQDGPTLVNGRTGVVTASVENADSIVWEKSASSNGPWETIPQATDQNLTFQVSSDWNNKFVRVVATNDEGTVRSGTVQIKTQNYAAPSFSVHPTVVTGFTGYAATVEARASAFPEISTENYGAEFSTDQGVTWTSIPGFYRSSATNLFVIPRITDEMNGALLRLSATAKEGQSAGSAGETGYSNTTTINVLPAADASRQLAVIGNTHIDPSQNTTLTVIGAGYEVLPKPSSTESYSVDLALFEYDQWKPGSGQLTRIEGITASPNSWVGGGAIYDSYLVARGGTLKVTLTIPAGKLDPTKVYGIGTYSRLYNTQGATNQWEDRSNDAWLPVVLARQEPARIVADPMDVTVNEPGDIARLEASVAGTPQPSIQWQRNAGSETGWQDIPDATSATYEVPVEWQDRGTQYRVVATNHLGEPSISNPASVGIAPQPLENAIPTIAGEPLVGQTLRADALGWTLGTEFTYQWLRDGQLIVGATSRDYTLTEADAQAQISVQVTGQLDGYQSATATSEPLTVPALPGPADPTDPVNPSEPKPSTPTPANPSTSPTNTATKLRKLKKGTVVVQGKKLVGKKLKAKLVGWKSKNVKVTYQWLRGGKKISGATSKTYRLRKKDRGKRIRVRIVVKNSGYRPASAKSRATKPIKAANKRIRSTVPAPQTYSRI